MQNPNDKPEGGKRKLPVTVIVDDSIVKDIKAGKCEVILAKLW